MLEVASDKIKSGYSDKVSVVIPAVVLSSLKREFSLAESEVESFVVSIIERCVMEHATTSNSAVFTESETKELEEDLRGLGYI